MANPFVTSLTSDPGTGNAVAGRADQFQGKHVASLIGGVTLTDADPVLGQEQKTLLRNYPDMMARTGSRRQQWMSQGGFQPSASGRLFEALDPLGNTAP